MEEAENVAREQVTESAAQRARLYRVLADTVEHQTTILQQIEKDLLARPTKTEGLKWIMAAFGVLLLVVGLMFATLLSVSRNNQVNGRIIRAATGCGSVSTVQECEKVILARSASQFAPFLQQQDCWTRRALAHLPPPASYTVPCQLP